MNADFSVLKKKSLNDEKFKAHFARTSKDFCDSDVLHVIVITHSTHHVPEHIPRI